MIGKGGGHCRVPAVLPPTYTLLFFLLYLICFAVDVLIPIQRSEASTVIGQSTTPQCEYTYHGCCPPPRASLAKNDEQGSNCLDTQNSIYIDTRDDIWCRVNNYTAPYAPFTTDRCSIHGAKCSPERPCCSTSQLTQGSLSTMGLPCYINGVSGVPVLKCVRFACAEVDGVTGEIMHRSETTISTYRFQRKEALLKRQHQERLKQKTGNFQARMKRKNKKITQLRRKGTKAINRANNKFRKQSRNRHSRTRNSRRRTNSQRQVVKRSWWSGRARKR